MCTLSSNDLISCLQYVSQICGGAAANARRTSIHRPNDQDNGLREQAPTSSGIHSNILTTIGSSQEMLVLECLTNEL
jgi:hypothetical protein